MDTPAWIILRDLENRSIARLEGTDAERGWTGLEVRRQWNAPGMVRLTLTGDHPSIPLLTPDIRVDVWRGNRRELVGLVGDYTHAQDARGQQVWTFPCLGALSLYGRAYVQWHTGTESRSQWTSVPTETILHDLIAYNVTPDGQDDRVSVPPDLGIIVFNNEFRGTIRSLNAHGDNVLEAVQKIAQLEGATVDLSLLEAPIPNQWLATYEPPRTPRDIVFAVDRGNIREAQLDVRRATAPTTAVVWGPGEGTERIVVVRSSAYVTTPPREIYVDARNVKMEDANWLEQLQQAGDDALYEQRPLDVFRFQPYPAPNAEYGQDWDLGDTVTVQFEGRTFTHRIMGVTLAYSDGMETIEIESETV